MAPDKCFTIITQNNRVLISLFLLLFFTIIIAPVSAGFWSTSSSSSSSTPSSSTSSSIQRSSSSLTLQDESSSTNEYRIVFNILENVPIGTFIGIIQSNDSSIFKPPFIIVPFSDSDQPLPSSSISSAGSINTRKSLSNTGFDINSQFSSNICNVDTELNIDQATGEIKSAVEFDRERCSHYSFLAISLTGFNIHVDIIIDDVNDNNPQFPVREIELEFAENSRPKDVKRSLPPARDLDRGQFGTQTYRIVSGNTGSAFRLISHREKDDVLYLDLQVNGILDRETIPSYRLLIEASDGGTPPLKDQLIVKINILDLNDNEPVFSQSHYYGSIPENATIGTQVLRVSATDADLDASGTVTYSLYMKNSISGGSSSSDSFTIHPTSGVISVAKALDYENQRLFELVVIAQDSGSVSLETSAFVSIRITDIADSLPTVSLLLLTTNSKPEVLENARVGDLIARIALNDAQGIETTVSGIELLGGEHDFGIKSSAAGGSSSSSTSGHLLTVFRPLDREQRSHYSLTIILKDKNGMKFNTSIELEILDVNDNPPRFDESEYYTTLPEAVDIGASVYQMRAKDSDSESSLTYAFLMEKQLTRDHSEDHLLDDEDEEEHSLLQWFNRNNQTHRLSSHTAWFAIEPRSGLIVTRTQVDCETDSEPRLSVYVTDAVPKDSSYTEFYGFSNVATLIVSISDINDNEPIFDQSFYNVTVREDRQVGSCILQISATDPDCGVNALVNYSIATNTVSLLQSTSSSHNSRSSFVDYDLEAIKNTERSNDFELNSKNGQLCILRALDFERQALYDIPVLATDRGGLSTQAMIKIQVLDTNDNFPVFYPREYKVNLNENALSNRVTPIVIVAATDKDSGINGRIDYSIESGNDLNLFEIDKKSGEIFLVRSLIEDYRTSEYRLTIGARDGGGLVSADHATVHISVLPDRESSPSTLPIFSQRSFNFDVVENCARGSVVGVVRAFVGQHDSTSTPISYSIYSGDPDGYFAIDSHSGTISVRSANLDREKHPYLLLNVQANTGGHGSAVRFAHTQVNITIIDENDNVPKFAASSIRISVSESTENGSVIFVAQAVDRDTGIYGTVRYSLYRAEGHTHSSDSEFPFFIENLTGKVRLRKKLDFETRAEYKLRVVAIDGGQLSSQMIVDLLVQDANDNSPVLIGASTVSNVDISTINPNIPSRMLPLFKLSVIENVHINSPIHQFKAHDSDSGNNARLTFTIENIQNPKVSSSGTTFPFDIFPNTGVVHVRDILDRETISTYHALVTVHDHGAPHQLNTSAIVQITVLDANDNRPQWKSIVYNFEISENAQIGSLVGTVQATDADDGLNSSLLYNFTDTTVGLSETVTFRLDAKTGQIFLAESLDRETKSQYELIVQVCDLGTPTLVSDEKAIITVQVLDVNDNRPVFDTENTVNPPQSLSHEDELDDADEIDNQSIVRIAVGTLKGSIVATFKASDPDAGINGTVKYSLSENNDLLEIEPDSGALITKVNIREHKRAIRLEKLSIIATDGGGKRSRPKNIEIELVDRKASHQINLENAPSYDFIIPEDVQKVSFGYRVGVLDLPTKRKNPCGNRLFTDYNHQNNDKIPFFVDSDEDKPSQLNLLTLSELNQTEYSLLLCIDWSQCSTTLIHYNDRQPQNYNLQLQCDHLTKIKVSHSHQQNVNCEPLPLGDNDHIYDVKISFSQISQQRNHLDLFTLNQTNCLFVQYELTSPNEIHEEYLNYFIISKQNDNSQAIFQFHVDESLSTLSEVIHRLATKHRELIFTLTAYWSVGSKSHTKSVPIRIKILSADKRLGNIVFLNENFLEVEEDCCRSGAGIVQARINVSHDDFRVRYYLEHSTESEQFLLNSDSGLITLKREFDYERRTHHQMNITAMIYDAKSLIVSVSQVLRIRVLNTNDESPVFTEQNYNCDVLENSEPGVFCARLIATDSDQPQSTNLTYLIAPSYEHASKFNLNSQTGELSIVGSLDRETVPSYDVPVYAFDQDNRHHAFKTVHVVVNDINDNMPRFIPSNTHIHIPENVAVGTRIAELIVEDLDYNPEGLKCTIISGNTGQHFILEGYELFVNSQLDREGQSSYELLINVSDGLHSALNNVTIELDDINDNAPIFEKSDYYAIIDLEGAYGWLPVVTVRAIDSDGDKLLYMIDTTSDDNEDKELNELKKFFVLNAETGEITIHRSLIESYFDRIPSKRFSFDVWAIEAGYKTYENHRSKARIHITIISYSKSSSALLNPNGLKLIKYPFVIVADKSRSEYRVGQEVGSINFVSGNEQLKRSGFYQFRVLSGGEAGQSFLDYFHLHSQTGAISVKQALEHDYYEAIVQVSHGSSNEATRTLLQIFIEDIDRTKFVTPVVVDNVRLPESHSVGSEIITLNEFVRFSSTRRYRFVLAYSNLKEFNSYFELKPQNGRLQLRKALDYETQPSKIEIIAFAYSSTGSLYEYCHLFNFTIDLLNVDDTLAQFTQSHYIGVVRESEQTGQIIGRVNAIDIDDEILLDNLQNNRSNVRRFGYFIVEGNEDNAFSITADGIVRTNIVLDREIVEHYKLRIVATDMRSHDSTQTAMRDVLSDEANYQHLTQCLFEVIIVDVNDNTPVFPPKIEISVGEDTLPGTIIGSATANDIDIHPVLMYQLKDLSESSNLFEIGLFTGKIHIKKSLSQTIKWSPEELVRPIELSVIASDRVNTVQTKVIVHIKRNISKMSPSFDKKFVNINADLDSDFAELLNEINVEMFRFEAINNSENRKIVYRLINHSKDSNDAIFYIDRNRGIVYNNRKLRNNRSTKLYQLIVLARFEDNIDQWTRMTLFINVERSTFGSRKSDSNTILFAGHHQLEIDSNQVGVSLFKFPKLINDQYAIYGGNNNKNFMILRGNELYLSSRPLTDHYSLKIGRSNIGVSASKNTTTFVHIKIRSGSSPESKAQSPFKSSVFELEIDENERINSLVQALIFSHVKEKYDFDIFAGNEANHFRIHPNDGSLLVNGQFDYETLPNYRLGIVAKSRDSDRVHFTIVNVVLNNINEFCPRFPSNFFKAIIHENSPIGTKVIPIRAIDEDNELLNFTVTKLATSPQDEDKKNLFVYDSKTGYLVVSGSIDYEQHFHDKQYIHKYVVRVIDLAMAITNSGFETRCSSVETLLEIQVGSVDEFAPKFSQESYQFKLTNSQTTNNKYRLKIGQVQATDNDSGPDGVIQFSIKNVSPSNLYDCLQINATSGLLSLSLHRLRRKIAVKKSGISALPKQFSLIITASSGRVNSLSSLAVVEVTVGNALFDDRLLESLSEDDSLIERLSEDDEFFKDLNSIDSDPLGSIHKDATLPGWLVFLTVLLLLVTVVLVVSIVVIRQAQAQQYLAAGHYPPRPPGGHVGSLFRKIGPFINSGPNNPIMEPNALSPAYSTAHYSNVGVNLNPPSYNEIPLNSNGICHGIVSGISQNLMLSSVPKGAEQSSSSGRGSAEEEEIDEEIRMINESSNYYTTGPEDDGPEEGEIPTTAEYLARLGVVNHYEEPENVSSLGGDDEDEQFNNTKRHHKRKKMPRVASSYSQYGPSTSSQLIAGNNPGTMGSMNSLAVQQVYNGEEIAGSYNWDYLQHWGPKYQPLSSVFSEIARLKASENAQNMTNSGHDSTNNPNTDVDSIRSCTQSHSSSIRSRTVRPQPIVAYQHFYELPPHHDSGSIDTHHLQQQQQKQQHQQHPNLYESYVLQSQASSNSNYSVYGMTDQTHAFKQIIQNTTSNIQQTALPKQSQDDSRKKLISNDAQNSSCSSSSQTLSIYNNRM